MAFDRSNVQTGDLIAWSGVTKDKSSLWLNLVRLGTMSNYGHVSVAWRIGPELYHYEATMPRIRVTKITDQAQFYFLPISKYLSKPADQSFFADKIGLRYSLLDAFRAYLGLTVHDDHRYQCAELSKQFYSSQGLEVHPKRLTPSGLIDAFMNEFDLPLMQVSGSPSTREITYGQ